MQIKNDKNCICCVCGMVSLCVWVMSSSLVHLLKRLQTKPFELDPNTKKKEWKKHLKNMQIANRNNKEVEWFEWN